MKLTKVRDYVATTTHGHLILYVNHDPRNSWDHYAIYGKNGYCILTVSTEKLRPLHYVRPTL